MLEVVSIMAIFSFPLAKTNEGENRHYNHDEADEIDYTVHNYSPFRAI